MLLIDVMWRSELDSSPGWLMLSLWVETGWIREFTIVVLGVEIGLSILADFDEVGDILTVGEVLVEVVLEVLDQIHMLLDKVISSHSREGESAVIELPSVNGNFWVHAEFAHFVINFHGVIVTLSIEASGEIVQFSIETSL